MNGDEMTPEEVAAAMPTKATTQRDELAAMRGELQDLVGDAAERDDDDWFMDAANAILAAGYRKPRTVTTVAELDALPVGSVVLSDTYRYMVHGGGDVGWPITFQRWDSGLWYRGGRSSDTHPDNFLPATVLYSPEATP
jgi:hypothetical protein